ncbi:MAG TPA: hypothetical protein DCL29_08045 [Eubacterium sp.]|nr:hypothetical protein [Eubacterium sp.]
MNKEEKELLLKDLCARLPYGVIVRHADSLEDSDGNYTGQFWYKRGYLYDVCRLDDITTTIIESEGSDEEGYKHICDLERSLPYLRPMSSMTEEEMKEYYTFQYKFTFQTHEHQELNKETFSEYLDWLNAHHFDYRGLIEKDLAIEVTEENNPYKN